MAVSCNGGDTSLNNHLYLLRFEKEYTALVSIINLLLNPTSADLEKNQTNI